MRFSAIPLLAGLIALSMFATAVAQQPARLPTRVTPPPSQVGVDRSREAQSVDKLNRDLDAASRRVQGDTLQNQLKRGDDQMAVDRARIERERGSATPAEQTRLRRELDARQSEHDGWRAGKEQQQQQLEVEGLPPPPPPNEVKAVPIEPR